jgi:hypothetical protein
VSAAWYQQVADVAPVALLVAVALVLAGAQLVWRALRGTARVTGSARRWVSTSFAVLVIALCVVGVAVGGFGPKGEARPSSSGRVAGIPPVADPVPLTIDPAQFHLPGSWKVDTVNSTSQIAVFHSSFADLQLTVLDTAGVMREDELTSDEGLAGTRVAINERAFADLPGYRNESIERTADIAGLPAIEHVFSIEFDGMRIPMHQFMALDTEGERYYTATASPVRAALTPGELRSIRADVEQVLLSR